MILDVVSCVGLFCSAGPALLADARAVNSLAATAVGSGWSRRILAPGADLSGVFGNAGLHSSDVAPHSSAAALRQLPVVGGGTRRIRAAVTPAEVTSAIPPGPGGIAVPRGSNPALSAVSSVQFKIHRIDVSSLTRGPRSIRPQPVPR